LILVEADPGQNVLVEVDVDESTEAIAPASRAGDLAAKAGKTFERAFEDVRPVADAIVRGLGGAAVRPDEIVVTFGLKMSVGAGAMIASTSGDANFEVTLTWAPKDQLRTPD
jgi:hypothetical protein